MSKKISVKTKKIHIIIVGGIFGELLKLPFIGNYMKRLMDLLLEYDGIDSCQYIQPYFWENEVTINKKITSAIHYQQFLLQKDIILLGHSKGGYDIINCLIQNSHLLTNKSIRGVLALNTPFQELYILKYFKKFPQWLQDLCQINIFTQKNCLQNKINKAQCKALNSFIKNKLITLNSTVTKKGEVPFILKPIHNLLNKKGFYNDGIMTIQEQKVRHPTLKTLHTNQHHGFYTCSALISKANRSEVKRLLNKLIAPLLKLESETSVSTKKCALNTFASPISVLTYNIGLLPIPVFGVPHAKTRLSQVPLFLNQQNADIICLQEAFGRKIRTLLQENMINYTLLASPAKPHSGLITLVKKSLFENNNICSEYIRFNKQRGTETLTGFEKGYLKCSFRHKNTKEVVTVSNLHLTAFNNASKIRKKQINQLIEENLSTENHIFCGDFNQSFLNTDPSPSYIESSNINRLKHWWLKGSSERIDYIFYKGKHDLREIKSKVIKSTASIEVEPNTFIELSDHEPVIAELSLA